MIERDQVAVRRAELRLVVGILVGWTLLMVAVIGAVVALRWW